jgi:hypothetical protein
LPAKKQGKPLPPPDGLIPRIVSMWNVGKGPIDDMSQVLATCLPTFGPINGTCWIWIRTWTMMLFNARRLNAISASSEIVLSDRCVTRKKFLAARTYHGKPFVEFLNTLYDSMEMRKYYTVANRPRSTMQCRPNDTRHGKEELRMTCGQRRKSG